MGDVVTVVINPYEKCPFTWVSEMTAMCGHTATIIEKEFYSNEDTYGYRIQEDDGNCIWCGNCFLPLDNPDRHLFSIGDRVCARLKNIDGNKRINVGDFGTICAIQDSGRQRVGVRWDNYVNGHDCGGACDYGFGWWTCSDEIEHDKLDDVEITEASFINMIGGSV